MEQTNNNSICGFNFKIGNDGITKDLRFEMYDENDFPKIEGNCVYIFSYFDKINKLYHHRHVSNTSDFNETFPNKDAKDHLTRYDSNLILVHKCKDEEDELKIEQSLRNQLNLSVK
jgi:hypothetical protein